MVLLKSMTISLVSATYKSRWLFPHQATNCPLLLTQPIWKPLQVTGASCTGSQRHTLWRGRDFFVSTTVWHTGWCFMHNTTVCNTELQLNPYAHLRDTSTILNWNLRFTQSLYKLQHWEKPISTQSFSLEPSPCWTDSVYFNPLLLGETLALIISMATHCSQH